ncbi:hypothetical protein EW146_g9437, partial [Bondarzewia mesenterica]
LANRIGQGDPLSIILYLYYNTDLLDVPHGPKESATSFVDDAAFIAVGKTFSEMHKTLARMMKRAGGGIDWSKDHNSCFEDSKLALIDFSRRRDPDTTHPGKTTLARCPPLTLPSVTIHPSTSGASPTSPQVYRLYSSDACTLPSTTQDVLEVHVFLLPVPLLIDKVCHRAALRIASIPPKHPLYRPVRDGATFNRKTNCSPLHDLMHIYGLKPNTIETIYPIRHLRPSARPAFSTHIKKDKKAAIATDRKLKSIIRVYTDGSAIDNKVGAAAFLYREDRRGEEPKKLLYHLGSTHDHTVFEVEAVGLTLAAELIRRKSTDICQLTSISLDNQAAIAATNLRRPKPRYHILDKFIKQVDHLQDTRGGAY